MDSLGEIIRGARKKKGLTTTQLAKLVGVSQGYISHLENNRKNNPSPEVIQKLSTILDIPLTDLMVKAGYIKTFGQTIKQLREENKWTLEDLERKSVNFDYGTPIYLNKNRLEHFENDLDTNPSVYELYLLAKAFDVDPWYFSTLNLKTPKKEMEDFLGTDNPPDPIGYMNNLLKYLYSNLIKASDQSERLDLVETIQATKNYKKRFIEQLNKLSANGEEVYKEDEDDYLININSSKFEKNYIINGNKITFIMPYKKDDEQSEIEFFNLQNLLYLSNKINLNGKFINDDQKEKILNAIKEILR